MSARAEIRKENLHRLVSEKEFFLESYFEKLKEWTFPSVWFELSEAECRALVSSRAQRLLGKPTSPLLDELAKKIDTFISGFGGLAVCRLSTRSAKDVVLFRDSTIPLFFEADAALQKQIGQPSSSTSSTSASAASTSSISSSSAATAEDQTGSAVVWREDVRQMIAMMRAAGRAMAVSSGQQAVDMFIDSQRVFDDLQQHLAQLKAFSSSSSSSSSPPSSTDSSSSASSSTDSSSSLSPPPPINVIVRKYVPLACELELRVFIANKKIAAISQYYATLEIPSLVARKEEIQARVFAAFEQILPLVELTDFVLDFALDMNDRLWVVEINLPPPVAGMALYDRDNPDDIAIVTGRAPFEFRVRPLRSLADPSDSRSKHQLFFAKARQSQTHPSSVASKSSRPQHRRRPSG